MTHETHQEAPLSDDELREKLLDLNMWACQRSVGLVAVLVSQSRVTSIGQALGARCSCPRYHEATAGLTRLVERACGQIDAPVKKGADA